MCVCVCVCVYPSFSVCECVYITWVLLQVGLHQVVEDVVLADPLHRAAAGGTEGGALHPARVAGSTERVHTGLETDTHTHTQIQCNI